MFPQTGCGPVGCAPGYGQYGYAASPYAAPYSMEIVGAAGDAVPAETFSEKFNKLRAQTTLGITNQNLVLGAVALGGIYYGYTQGWFGKSRR